MVERIVFVEVFPEVVKDFLNVELRLLLQLCHENGLGNSDLLLTFFKVLAILRI